MRPTQKRKKERIDMAKTLVGVFDEKASAQSAVKELQAVGVASDHVRLMNGHDDASGSGEGEGASDPSWLDKVGHWFTSLASDEADRGHADDYAEAYRRGQYVVVVDVENDRVDAAAAILNKLGTVDVSRRAEYWRSKGYKGFDRTAPLYTTAQRDQEVAGYKTATADVSIPVVQEELVVGKRVVQRQGVRVHSYVKETPVHEVVRLREEHIDVQRRPVDRAVAPGDQAFKERTVDVKAFGEEAVVGKTAHVVEEVTIGKNVGQRSETVTETVRRKDVEVETVGPAGTSNREPKR